MSSPCSNIRHLAIVALLLATTVRLSAKALPEVDGERVRYGVQIDIRNAYISGVCIMLGDEGVVKASIVNEFGVSAMDFVYSPAGNKVRLVSVIGKLDKWYIRRVLRKDLLKVIHALENGDMAYVNKRLRITYTFSEMNDEE